MERDVPPEFMDGVAAIEVTAKTVPHPTRADVFTLGECIPHAFGGPDDEGPTLRSTVQLHYGSFAALARISPDLDWREEAWETLTHELRHHLEWRSRVGALEAFDDAVEANYARMEGGTFDPLFFANGESVSEGVYKVEDDVFIDVPLRAREWREAGGRKQEVHWHGRRYTVALPAKLPEVLFLMLEGVEPEPAGELVLVVRRRPGAFDLLRRTTVGSTSAEVAPAT